MSVDFPDEIWVARHSGLLTFVSSREEGEDDGAAVSRYVRSEDYEALRDGVREAAMEAREMSVAIEKRLAQYPAASPVLRATFRAIGRYYERTADFLAALDDTTGEGG